MSSGTLQNVRDTTIISLASAAFAAFVTSDYSQHAKTRSN